MLIEHTFGRNGSEQRSDVRIHSHHSPYRREGVDGVVEEPKPADLRANRRRFVRFETARLTQTELTTDGEKRL
jgi:hypothetical protein